MKPPDDVEGILWALERSGARIFELEGELRREQAQHKITAYLLEQCRRAHPGSDTCRPTPQPDPPSTSSSTT